MGSCRRSSANLNIVYLLTGGGPPIAGAEMPARHRDLPITYTYRLMPFIWLQRSLVSNLTAGAGKG